MSGFLKPSTGTSYQRRTSRSSRPQAFERASETVFHLQREIQRAQPVVSDVSLSMRSVAQVAKYSTWGVIGHPIFSYDRAEIAIAAALAASFAGPARWRATALEM